MNPEIGPTTTFVRWPTTCTQRGMGILLDIVPNHMGIGPENPYWDDVLAHGERSRYARWFDIDWDAADAHKSSFPFSATSSTRCSARDELTLDVKEKTPRALLLRAIPGPSIRRRCPKSCSSCKLDPRRRYLTRR